MVRSVEAQSYWARSVLPTRVGMVRLKSRSRSGLLVLPTRVGMVRYWRNIEARSIAFSPRAWGWSGDSCTGSNVRCSPHARGDGPGVRSTGSLVSGFSPRAWGWSAIHGRRLDVQPSSPHARGDGPAEVSRSRAPRKRSPHARGDGPVILPLPSDAVMFSPRAWGWSGDLYRDSHLPAFSPRAWGWSGGCAPFTPCRRVLPTRVGMVRAC